MDDAGWNIQDPFDIGESTDTSRDKTKAIHTYEIAHRYQNDGQWGIGCAMKGDMDSGSQRDTDEPGCVNGVFAHKVWDMACVQCHRAPRRTPEHHLARGITEYMYNHREQR
jgi:hypothetical protein